MACSSCLTSASICFFSSSSSSQGVIEYHPQVLSYFHKRQVSIVLLLRRNVLRRLVSILANAHDRKLRGNEHKAHTHDTEEVRVKSGGPCKVHFSMI